MIDPIFKHINVCSCNSTMALRILSFKSLIFSGLSPHRTNNSPTVSNRSSVKTSSALRLIMQSLKTSNVASAVWHVVPSCWNQMLPISSSSIFAHCLHFAFCPLLAHFPRKMAQLCLWTKIRTKQWLILGASAF